MNNRLFTFVGGETGRWRVQQIRSVIGVSVDSVSHVDVCNGECSPSPVHARWQFRGVTSNQRYTQRSEQNALLAVQPALGRTDATCAALIPITKTAKWWEMTQDERREVIEARSSHIATGLRYLPAIARRLHHSRDLGEPFDFLTWFEFAPADATVFDDLLDELRGTEEWAYVERELEIRLTRED